jgi:hypothetical protein
MDLLDVYRIFHPNAAQSSQQLMELSPNIDHILGPKASLSKYKKIEIIPCIPPDYMH